MADTSVLDNAEKRTLPYPAMPGSPLTARQRAYLAGRRAQDIVPHCWRWWCLHR